MGGAQGAPLQGCRRADRLPCRWPWSPILLTIIFELAQRLLNLFWWAVVLAAIVQTLISFGVLDRRNRLVWGIGDFLYRITEPALRPIRRFVPDFGGVDLSYLVLLFLIWVVQMLLVRVYDAIVTQSVQGLFL